MKRNKAPEKVPVAGLPRGMLATYAFHQGNLDAPVYSQIQREAREAREQQQEAQQKRDVLNARRRRNAAMQFRRSGSTTLVPLRNVAVSVRIRTETHQRLMVDGFCGSDWAYDDESGCIRCRRRNIAKSHPDYGVWFDVGALAGR
ncbi:hypothetical protein SB778_33825 [Paraburkholderia sp. SIMBA_050]